MSVELPTKWDAKFMNLAKEMSTWSKDRSRQTACIIVGPGKEVRSTGYNGFPRGCYDEASDLRLPLSSNRAVAAYFTDNRTPLGYPAKGSKYGLLSLEEKARLVEERHERPAKYAWTEHAERNAIYAAARMGTPLLGCTAYIPWYPCADCARALIQVGIANLVCYEPDWNDPVWAKDFAIVPVMLEEGGVTVKMLANPNPQKPKGDISNAQVR